MTRMHLMHDEVNLPPAEEQVDLRTTEQLAVEDDELIDEEPAWGADPMLILEFRQEHEA